MEQCIALVDSYQLKSQTKKQTVLPVEVKDYILR